MTCCALLAHMFWFGDSSALGSVWRYELMQPKQPRVLLGFVRCYTEAEQYEKVSCVVVVHSITVLADIVVLKKCCC
eukprot:5356322-Amphidinium_carterae.1